MVDPYEDPELYSLLCEEECNEEINTERNYNLEIYMKELFRNDNYCVKINEANTSYLIINHKTEVVEHETSMLPEAFKVAYLMDMALKENEDHSKDQIQRVMDDLIVPPGSVN